VFSWRVLLAASPSAPFGITLLSCDGSSMTLAWKRPKHCGGSKVTAYYLDHRHADALRWREVNQEAVREEVYTVSTEGGGGGGGGGLHCEYRGRRRRRAPL